jgi:hypothetical protein
MKHKLKAVAMFAGGWLANMAGVPGPEDVAKLKRELARKKEAAA